MGFFLSKPQRQWLVVIVFVSLLLPIILATLLVLIGNTSGCQMVGETAQICLVRGINIGRAIKSLIDWTWYLPVMSIFQVPILTIALFIGLLVLIYKSFRGKNRILIGVLGIWYLFFAPLISGIIFVTSLARQAQCSLNEGGVGSCYLFGINMGATFHAAATLPWLLIILFPLCAVTSVIYIAIVLAKNK